MPASVPRSVMPRAGRPSTAARANSSSTWEAPRRKEKFVVVWSSVYNGLTVCSGVGGIILAFVLGRGSMIPGGRGVLGERGEEDGGLVAGKLTGRVIGMAIRIKKRSGRGFLKVFM